MVVFLSRSAYFSALGLVMVTCGYRGLLVVGGGVFMGLILFLIYLGGMLVVFAYSAALAADMYPEVGFNKFRLIRGIGLVVFVIVGLEFEFDIKGGAGGWVQEDLLGVAELYRNVWPGLLLAGFVLFICLFVVLFLVKGGERAALRAVSESSLI